MLRIFLPSFTHNSRLIIAIVVFLFAVFATVYLIRSKSTFSDDSYGAWILRDWLATNQNSKIIILGDSQLGGLRAADAKQAGRKLDFVLDHRGYKLESILATGPSSVFVSAQPGSLVSDYYATLRALVDRSRCTPRMVILTVSPRVFLNNGLSYPGESDYYRYFSTVTNLKEADALAYRSVFDRLGEDVRSRMRRPLLAVQPSQFVFLPNDLQMYQERQLMPPDLRVEQVSMNNQLGFLQKTINFLNAKKIYCLVVSMPVASGPTHEKYRRMSIELCKKLATHSSSKDFSFINLDNMCFQNDDFLDSIHLSQKGGETFAKAIAGYLNDSNLTRLIR